MNKKGFTLVELLAVIVILGIILLIAVPKILNVINDSKVSVFQNSAKIIYRSSENYFISEIEKNDGGSIVLDLGENGDHIVPFDGEYPDNGKTIMDSEGNIAMYVYNDKLEICGVKDYGTEDITFSYNISLESCEDLIDQPVFLDDVVSIGDYIEYDAGNWNSTVTYASIVGNDGMHGGYTSGTSRNQAIACESSGSVVSGRTGWRVLDIDSATGIVSILHVGSPECYYNGVATETSINNLKNYNYSYYVNTVYATTATIFTKEMAETLITKIGAADDPDVPIISDDGFYNGRTLDQLMLAGARYYFPNAYDGIGRLFYVQSGGYVSGYRYIAYGIRPVVNLKPDRLVVSGLGTSADKYVMKTDEVFIGVSG